MRVRKFERNYGRRRRGKKAGKGLSVIGVRQRDPSASTRILRGEQETSARLRNKGEVLLNSPASEVETEIPLSCFQL